MKHFLLILAVVALVGCASVPGDGPSRAKRTKAKPSVEAAIRIKAKKPTGELTKEDFDKVKMLYLEEYQLTKVPKALEKLTQLGVLSLYYNKLTNVNGLAKCTQLKQLNLEGNQITDVTALENLTKLIILRFRSNQMTNVPKGLEKLTQLKNLGLYHNQLTDLKGLEELTQLTELDLHKNNLTNVKDLEKLTQLTNLSLSSNKLTDVKGLEKFTQLTEMYLRDNPDLTKAQIDQLKKALPNCEIESNPTK